MLRIAINEISKPLVQARRLASWLGGQFVGDRMSSLVRRASAVLLTQLCGAAAMFLSGILLGRWLGAEAYGHYSFAITIIVVLRIGASLGMPMLVMRTAAIYHGEKDWAHLNGLLRFAGLTNLISGPAFALICAGAIFLFLPSPLSPAIKLILTALPLLLVLPISETAANAIRGLQRVSAGQMSEFARAALYLAFLLGAVALLNAPITSGLAIWLRLAAESLGMVLTLVLLLRLLPKGLWGTTPNLATSQWRKGQMSFLAVDAMYLIYQQTDVLVLGLLRPMHEVGVYRMAANLVYLLVFASIIASAALAPLAASAWAAGKSEELRQAATRLSRLAFGLTFALFLLLLAATPIFIDILGSDFSGLVWPLAILGGAQLVRALMSASPTIVLMTGNEREGARVVALSALLNVVLNFTLINIFGMIGAAVATSISTVFYSLYHASIAYKHTGISGGALGRSRPK